MKMEDRVILRLAPLIAIIGPDGAGKTSTAHYLCSTFTNSSYAYLGLGSGAVAARIRKWPLLGASLERYLSSRARRARNPSEQIPGVVTALAIYLFSRLRWRRFLHVLHLRETGQLVICDRYPQVQVIGLNDGPGLSVATAKGGLTAWLARLEHRLYADMAQIPPTLVIRLNIDAQTAWSRKPDHELALIERKVATTAGLTFEGARVVEVDACLPQAEVHAICRRLVEGVIEKGLWQPGALKAQAAHLEKR